VEYGNFEEEYDHFGLPVVIEIEEAGNNTICVDCIIKGENDVPANFAIKTADKEYWQYICIDCADDYDMSLVSER